MSFRLRVIDVKEDQQRPFAEQRLVDQFDGEMPRIGVAAGRPAHVQWEPTVLSW
jgi:hypothetical protein